jgi:hypothetical protein
VMPDGLPIIGLAVATGSAGSLEDKPLEVAQTLFDNRLAPHFQLGGKLLGLHPNRLEDREFSKLPDKFGRLMAVQLNMPQIQPSRSLTNTGRIRINEQSHRRNERRQRCQYLRRPCKCDVARSGGIKDQSDGIRPGACRGKGVFDVPDATELDSRPSHAADAKCCALPEQIRAASHAWRPWESRPILQVRLTRLFL